MEEGLTSFDEMKLTDDEKPDFDKIRAALSIPTPRRLLYVAQAMRHGMTNEEIFDACKIDPWFLERIRVIIDTEEPVKEKGLPIDQSGWLKVKQLGFGDARLAKLVNVEEQTVTTARLKNNVHEVFKRVDTCAAEIPSETPYMYSTYETPLFGEAEDESEPTDRKKVVILGGGPNRIGQGI